MFSTDYFAQDYFAGDYFAVIADTGPTARDSWAIPEPDDDLEIIDIIISFLNATRNFR